MKDEIYLVVVERRSSDPEYYIFTGEGAKAKAEKCYEDNQPRREHDVVELHSETVSNGEALFYFADKRKEI